MQVKSLHMSRRQRGDDRPPAGPPRDFSNGNLNATPAARASEWHSWLKGYSQAPPSGSNGKWRDQHSAVLNRDQRPGSFHPMQKHLHVSPSCQCTAGRREELLSFEGLTLLMHLLGVFSHLLRKTLSGPTNKELTKHQFLEMFGFYNYVMMD